MHLAIHVSDEAIQVIVFVHIDAERLRVPNTGIECSPEELIIARPRHERQTTVTSQLREIAARHIAVSVIAAILPVLHARTYLTIVILRAIIRYNTVQVAIAIEVGAEWSSVFLVRADENKIVIVTILILKISFLKLILIAIVCFVVQITIFASIDARVFGNKLEVQAKWHNLIQSRIKLKIGNLLELVVRRIGIA